MAEPTYKKIDLYYYDPAKPLGKGAFAVVYKAFDERTNEPVAVKVVPSVKLLESEDQYNLFMREINVLREIKGDHIVRLLDVKRTSNNLYIFTDYCDGGDLEKKLKAKHPFTEEEACSILKQMAHAFVTLEDMHIVNSKGHKVIIMHRDIKAANILFHQGRIKVADFGFAKLIDEVDKNTKKAHTLLGTPLYMAPQILNDENYSTKCDIWSTGVLFYEILFGKLPWTGHSVPNLYSNIKSKPLTFPKNIHDDTKDLINKMLKIKEEERLSWKDVYNHPALKNSVIPTVQKPAPQQAPVSQPTGQQQQQQQNSSQGSTQPTSSGGSQQQQQAYPMQGYPQQQGGGYPQQGGYPQYGGQQGYPQQGGYPQYGGQGYPQNFGQQQNPYAQQQQQQQQQQGYPHQQQQQGYPYQQQQQQQQNPYAQQQQGYPQYPGYQNYPGAPQQK